MNNDIHNIPYDPPLILNFVLLNSKNHYQPAKNMKFKKTILLKNKTHASVIDGQGTLASRWFQKLNKVARN